MNFLRRLSRSILTGLLFCACAGAAQAVSTPGDPGRVETWRNSESWFFVENRGQVSDLDGQPRPDIRFVLYAGSMRVFLRATGFSYVVTQLPSREHHDDAVDDAAASPKSEPPLTLERTDVDFVACNPSPVVRGDDRMAWYANIYTAQLPGGATFLPVYRSVVYENVYPGIDLVFRLESTGLKYEFIVRPSGNAGNILLRYSHNAQLALRDGGDLDVRTSTGTLTEQAPRCYAQGPDGSGSIDGSFVLGDRSVSFRLGESAPGATIVIDPSVDWATMIGSNADDYGGGVDVDPNGDPWMVGSTTGTNFPTTAGVFQQSHSAATIDAFVIKFSSGGSRLWATYYAGANVAEGLTCDNAGHGYFTGTTNSTLFPTSAGAFQTSKSTGYDAFLVKLLTNGTRAWATLYGGDGDEVGMGLVFDDNSGRMYMTGQTTSSTFPVTSGAFQTTYGGSTDAFLIKFDTSGARLWSTYIGSSTLQFGHGCAIDSLGNVLVAGKTGTGFPTTSGTVQSTFPGGTYSAYCIKFDSSGARLWATYFGSNTIGYDVGCYGNDVLLTGYTTGTIPVTAGCFQYNKAAGEDAWFTRINSGGSTVIWATYFGGNGNDHATSISVNSFGRIHLTGCTFSTNFPVTANAYQSTYSGVEDRFTATFNAQGQRCWATYIGGAAQDHCWTSPAIGERTEHSIAVHSNGDFYFIGNTEGSVPTTAGAFQQNSAGARESFLYKFLNDCSGMLTANAGNDITICRGASTRLGQTATGSPCGMPYTYSWSPPTWLSAPDSARPWATPPATTTYVVTVTDADNCIAKDTVIVTVASLGADITPDTSSICPGRNVTLYATTGSGYTYVWQRNGATIGGATSSTYTATQPGNYRVIISNASGCHDTSDIALVLSSPGPGATITPGGPTSFCSGDSVVLYANTGVRFTYSWLRNGAATGGTGPTYTARSAGSYRVIVTDSLGCADTSAVIVVSVLPGPGATISPAGPTSFCDGGSVLLNANTGTGYIYEWQRDLSTIAGATASSYLATIAGSYRVIVTNSQGCRDTSASVTVTVWPRPGATITPGGPTTFCDGLAVALNANTGMGYTYNWQKNGASIPSASGSTYWAMQSGSYRVIVTNSYGCTDTSAAIVVTVLPRPRAAITAMGPISFCEGGSVLLRADTATGWTYQWRKDGLVIPGATTPAYTATAAGSYRVVVTNTFGCADTSAAVTVTVYPRPDATISAAPLTICEGQSSLLSTITGSGYTYVWQRNGASIGGATGATYAATIAGNYRVIVTTGQGCIDTSDAIAITVLPKPYVSLSAAGPTSFCEPGCVLLIASGSAGVRYSWQRDGAEIMGADSARYLACESGQYRSVVTDANGCSDTSTAITVTVYPRPVAEITPPGQVALCAGGTLVLVATTGSGYQYQWQYGGTAIVGATQSTYTAKQPGSYRVIITTGNGCVDTSLATVLTVSPLPPQRIEGKTSACPNTIASYFVTNSAGYSFDWSLVNGTLLGGQGTPKIDVKWGGTGTGEVRVRITNDTTGCAKDTVLKVSITTSLKPLIASTGSSVLCEGDSMTLDASAGYTTYSWELNGVSTGDTTRTIVVRTAGSYTVSVTDASGCSGTSAPFMVTVWPRPTVRLTASGPTTICAGDKLTLTAYAVPIADFTWWRDSTQILGATGSTLVVTQSGRYRVIGTTQAGCAAASDPVDVVVKDRPKAEATALGPSTICDGDSVQLKARPESGYAYQWLRDGSMVADADKGTLTVRASGSYRVIVIDVVAGCRDTSLAVTVLVRPALTVRIDGATDFCEGDSAVLTASGSAGQVRWSSGETTRRIVVTAGGTYTVTVTDSGGCTAGAGVLVTRHARPHAAIQGSRTICKSGQTVLDAGAGYASYRWSSGATTRMITVGAAGLFWVEVKDSSGCAASDTAIVIESDRLMPTISGRTAICPGGSVILEADSNDSYVEYIWSTEADTTAHLGSQRRFIATGAGRYMVRVADRGGCSGYAVITVTDAAIVRPVIAGRQYICSGLPADTLDAGAGFVSYRWNTGATSRLMAVTAAGTYAVDVVDTNGCTWNTSVVVRERLITPVITGSKTFCAGGAARLSVQWPGAVAYEWSSGDRNRDVTIGTPGPVWVRVTDSSGCEGIARDTIVASTSLKPNVGGAREFCHGTGTQLDAGPYMLWYRWSGSDTTVVLSTARTLDVRQGGVIILRLADSSGCEGIDTIMVAELPPLAARITGDSVLCPGGSARLSVSAPFAGYAWSTGATSDTITVLVPGPYWVRVVDSAGCVDTARIVVQSQSELTISIAGRTAFCAGSSDTLDAGPGYASYRWSTTDTTVLLGTGRTLAVTQTGTYVVRVATPSGCTGSGSIAVTVYALPDPRITRNGDQLETTVFVSYQWMKYGADIPGATGRQLLPGATGSYQVRVIDGNGCTGVSPPVDITVTATAQLGLLCPELKEYPVGTIVSVPLYLEQMLDASSGSALAFTAVLTTDPGILYPRFTPASSSGAGRSVTLRVPGRRDPSMTAGVLLELPFEVLWGDSACARVRIDSILWSDGTITDLHNAECDICAALCRSGGVRLFHAEGRVTFMQNRPNPFNATTVIEFELIERGMTDVSVFDMVGRRVATLFHEDAVPGRYLVRFDAGALASGTYLCLLRTPGEHRSMLMEVAK